MGTSFKEKRVSCMSHTVLEELILSGRDPFRATYAMLKELYGRRGQVQGCFINTVLPGSEVGISVCFLWLIVGCLV